MVKTHGPHADVGIWIEGASVGWLTMLREQVGPFVALLSPAIIILDGKPSSLPELGQL